MRQPQSFDLCNIQRLDRAGCSSHPRKRCVVKQESLTIATDPDVTFDAKSSGDGSVECSHAVFADPRPM